MTEILLCKAVFGIVMYFAIPEPCYHLISTDEEAVGVRSVHGIVNNHENIEHIEKQTLFFFDKNEYVSKLGSRTL